MDPSRVARLKKYSQLITRNHGGMEGLLASKLLSQTEAPTDTALVSPLELFQAPNPHLAGVREALESMSIGKLPSPLSRPDHRLATPAPSLPLPGGGGQPAADHRDFSRIPTPDLPDLRGHMTGLLGISGAALTTGKSLVESKP